MHYHVMSGPRRKTAVTSLKFQDKMEGITAFINMAKVIWAHLEAPPPHKEIKKSKTISIIRMQDEATKLVFVYCNRDNCDESDNLEFKIQL